MKNRLVIFLIISMNLSHAQVGDVIWEENFDNLDNWAERLADIPVQQGMLNRSTRDRCASPRQSVGSGFPGPSYSITWGPQQGQIGTRRGAVR